VIELEVVAVFGLLC